MAHYPLWEYYSVSDATSIILSPRSVICRRDITQCLHMATGSSVVSNERESPGRSYVSHRNIWMFLPLKWSNLLLSKTSVTISQLEWHVHYVVDAVYLMQKWCKFALGITWEVLEYPTRLKWKLMLCFWQLDNASRILPLYDLNTLPQHNNSPWGAPLYRARLYLHWLNIGSTGRLQLTSSTLHLTWFYFSFCHVPHSLVFATLTFSVKLFLQLPTLIY